MKNYENILGFNVYNNTIEKLIDSLNLELDSSRKSKVSISCLNPHSYIVSKKNKKFKKSLEESTYIIPDGVGIKLASQLFFTATIRNSIPGPDFFIKFCELTQDKYTHFFLGSIDEVLITLTKNMQKKYNIKIGGYHSPPYKPEFSDEDNNMIINNINKSNSTILWVGLTSPKQDIWINENIEKLDNIKLASGIGAAFDFYGGDIKRAPEFFQKYALEGYYRLYKEPRRIFKRAFISDPLFVLDVIKKYVENKLNGK